MIALDEQTEQRRVVSERRNKLCLVPSSPRVFASTYRPFIDCQSTTEYRTAPLGHRRSVPDRRVVAVPHTMPDEKYPPGPSSGSSTAPLLPVTRKRSSSTSSEESASGANGRARSSSYGEAGLKQSPKVLVHQLLARVKRRPLPWGFGFVVLLWASWLVGRSATRGRLADWRSGQGKLDGMQDDALLEEGSVYSASEGLYRLDKDPTKYVKPTREELQRYIGEDPKWLVKDNGAGYG